MQDLTQLDSLLNESGMLRSWHVGYLLDILPSALNISLTTPQGDKINCFLHTAATDAAPIILYFHDPATEDLTNLAETAKNFQSAQLNFLAVEYCHSADDKTGYSHLLLRGVDIVVAACQWLKNNGYDGQIFLMGQSIGGNVALNSAAKHTELIKGLILEDLIGETASFCRSFAPEFAELDMSETDGFNCLQLIAELKTPTLFFHGAKDILVSTRDAEKLQSYSGARTKQFYIIPGAERGHLQQIGGDLYFQTIKKFTDTVCGTNTWREKRRKFKAGL